MELYPISVASFRNFSQAVFFILAAWQWIEKKFCFRPSVTGYFCPDWSGSLDPVAIHSHDEDMQPCLYFK